MLPSLLATQSLTPEWNQTSLQEGSAKPGSSEWNSAHDWCHGYSINHTPSLLSSLPARRTYFWGFCIVTSMLDDVLAYAHLDDLTSRSWDYQLINLNSECACTHSDDGTRSYEQMLEDLPHSHYEKAQHSRVRIIK